MSSLAHLEGPSGWAPSASARRRVEPEDIAFARANRPRMGWQTIARIRGVNEIDLRRVVEGGAALVRKAAAPAVKAPAAKTEIKPGSASARVLLAIASGTRTLAATALEAEVREETARGCLPKLKDAGLIGDRGDEGWPLTAAGVQAVRALKRAEASRG
jgi:hypothetical protein